MAHCINITIAKQEDLKENVKYVVLPLNYCFIKNTNDVKEGCKCLTVYTDYFGGLGEQYAELYINGLMVKEYNTINEGLRELNVTKGYSDEFDAINLGNYRSNDDILIE